MPKILAATSILWLTLAAVCSAQVREERPVTEPVAPSSPLVPPMIVPWAHSQGHDRYDSPRQAVRRNAEWKASQRRQRIAALKALGYSPLRPPASPVPFMGSRGIWVYFDPDPRLSSVLLVPATRSVVVERAVESTSP